MSLINLLLRIYGSIRITEKKPLFYYNYPFYTATRSYFTRLKKKQLGSGEHVNLQPFLPA